MTAFLREEVERHSRPATADAGEPAASPAPAPGGGSEEASADPHYAPRVVELGLRRLPRGLGGAGGSNVVFDWPPGDRFDGWAVDGAARRAPGHVLRRRARDPNPPARAGAMAGRGTYTFAAGGSLECDFAGDRAQGKGVLKLPDGTTYKGAFVDGAMHGRGVLRANGATYKGAFAANMFHGKGKLTFPSGDTYSGAFAKHAFHGKGVYAWRSGKRYEGHFRGGRLTGDGVYTWTEGQKYTGAYVNGRREGRGERASAPPRRRGAPRRPTRARAQARGRLRPALRGRVGGRRAPRRGRLHVVELRVRRGRLPPGPLRRPGQGGRVADVGPRQPLRRRLRVVEAPPPVKEFLTSRGRRGPRPRGARRRRRT